MAEAGIEQSGGFEQIYERLDALNPETGRWLALVIDVVADFETDYYKANPQLLDHALPNLEDDTSELMHYLLQISSENQTEIRMMLTGLAIELRTNRPVIAYALRGVFDYFGINSEVNSAPTTKDARPRFYMPNVAFERPTDLIRFVSACGLTHARNPSNGSAHSTWVTEEGRSYTVSTGDVGNGKYVKKIVKDLLDKGVPIEKIKGACNKCNIPLTIL